MRVYTVVFSGQTFTAANGDYDFVELSAADDVPICILGWDISNKSEVKDAEEEMVDLRIVRGNTTTGNGTATTPRPVDPGDPAASFAAETVSSTPASAGTAVELFSKNFNIRAGDVYLLPPEMRFRTTQAAGFLCLRLATALVDDATLSGTVWVGEGI